MTANRLKALPALQNLFSEEDVETYRISFYPQMGADFHRCGQGIFSILRALCAFCEGDF